MKSKEEIAMILYDNLDSVYCNTCDSQENDEYCDECHRKAMNWAISKEFAERLAEKILS
jgi:hypothetical protein